MYDFPLVSIIVPIYMVEEYLPRCIESIVNQSYENIEIILVNDGSKDKCPEICNRYSKLDNRIKVINKENGGLSDARNAGLNIASGQYVGFVDSDDWIENDMIETLVKLLINHNADIAECGFKFIYKDYIDEVLDNKITVLKNIKAVECFLDRSIDIKGAVCNKLYHRNIVEKLRFPVGKLHEDGFFTYKALYYSKKYVRTESCKYNYIQERQGSIMSSKENPLNILTVIEAFEERNTFFKGENEEVLFLKSKAYYYSTLLSEYKKIIFNNNADDRLKMTLKSKLLKNFKDIYKNPYTNKVKFSLIRILLLFN